MARLLIALCLALSVVVAGCGGAGPYGYAREYEPIDGERAWIERSHELSYEEVRRMRPEVAANETVGWFGVVTEEPVTEGSSMRLTLSLRAHQERHLCDAAESSSCRVTVSQREIGVFTATISPRPEDLAEGRNRLWTGSLVRVYGTPTGVNDEQDRPVIQGQWYRHWPHGTYVTTFAASSMRR